MENAQMTNYIVPTSGRCAVNTSDFSGESLSGHGLMGAKGIGELPIDGPAPAVVNAIEDAIGVSVNRIPALSEILMEAAEMVHVF